MNIELKRCPFCGNEAAINKTVISDPETIRLNKRDTGYGVNWVRCGVNNKGFVLGYPTPERAAEVWNFRPTSRPDEISRLAWRAHFPEGRPEIGDWHDWAQDHLRIESLKDEGCRIEYAYAASGWHPEDVRKIIEDVKRGNHGFDDEVMGCGRACDEIMRLLDALADRSMIPWRSFADASPEPDTLVLAWDQRTVDGGCGPGYIIIDFDHDSDASYWLERGITHWATINEPKA